MKLDHHKILTRGMFYSKVASAIALMPIAWGCVKGEPASSLTLQVPLTDERVEASTWCQATNATNQGEPFAFQRVRFYQDATDVENRQYLIGCITNHTGYVVESLPASYNMQFSPYTSRIHSGFNSFELPTLQPGQTGFFRTGFEIDANAIGVEIDLQRSMRGQMFRYEPVQRLIIQRQP